MGMGFWGHWDGGDIGDGDIEVKRDGGDIRDGDLGVTRDGVIKFGVTKDGGDIGDGDIGVTRMVGTSGMGIWGSPGMGSSSLGSPGWWGHRGWGFGVTRDCGDIGDGVLGSPGWWRH